MWMTNNRPWVCLNSSQKKTTEDSVRLHLMCITQFKFSILPETSLFPISGQMQHRNDKIIHCFIINKAGFAHLKCTNCYQSTECACLGLLKELIFHSEDWNKTFLYCSARDSTFLPHADLALSPFLSGWPEGAKRKISR